MFWQRFRLVHIHGVAESVETGPMNYSVMLDEDNAAIAKQELDMTKILISSMHKKFEPELYHNEAASI